MLHMLLRQGKRPLDRRGLASTALQPEATGESLDAAGRGPAYMQG